MATSADVYPASLSIDYPDRELDRVTTLFRLFTIIPIAIVLSLIGGPILSWTGVDQWSYEYASGSIIVLPTVLMILFQQKYPRWWFDWNLALTRFSTRVAAYFLLLTDQYPSTDEEQAVHIEIPYPDVKEELSNWMPLVKWFLAIPHYIILCFLYIAVLVCAVISWFAIIFTGRYPRDLFDFVVSVFRWTIRVSAYAGLLTTDRYPPFSLAI